MAEITLDVEVGRSTGTRPARRLRREDRVPAVLYGQGVDSVAVSVDRRALRAALTTDAGLNALLSLVVEGKRHLAVVRDIQRHPVRRSVIHVDFLAVDPDQMLRVDVPIVLHGEAEEVHKVDGGTLDQNLHTLAVLAKPTGIPNEITVDITALEVGNSIRVGDLQLPEGVTTDLDPEEPVVTATVVAIEAPPEGEEGEGEGAEGEEGAAGAPAEATEGGGGETAEGGGEG